MLTIKYNINNKINTYVLHELLIKLKFFKYFIITIYDFKNYVNKTSLLIYLILIHYWNNVKLQCLLFIIIYYLLLILLFIICFLIIIFCYLILLKYIILYIYYILLYIKIYYIKMNEKNVKE